MSKKLPKIILVRYDGAEGDEFLAAHSDVTEAIGDADGVVEIGTYVLHEVRKMRKVATTISTKKIR